MTTGKICAHRGLHTVLPENSLPALASAVALGADEIEFGLWTTKDGILVAVPEEDLGKISDGTGNVKDYDYKELKKLDFGIKYGEKFKGLKIVSFEDVLRQLGGRTVMNIYVCIWDGADNPIMIDRITGAVRKYGCEKSVYFTCGNKNSLKKAKEYAPDISFCLHAGSDYMNVVDNALYAKADRVQFLKPYFNAEMIEKAHKNGLVCGIYSSDEK